MFCRLLSIFPVSPERQWTFFGEEGPPTDRQGGSMLDPMATRPDVDLHRSSLGLSGYMWLVGLV